MTTTILVLSGGGPAPTTPLPSFDVVIAADSGYALAAELGVEVDLVVGDLDSIAAADLDRADRADVAFEVHPADKDATDLELAFLAALERGGDRIVVAGGGAGRLDHLLGVAMLLADDRWADIAVEWHAGSSVAHIVRWRLQCDTEVGDVISVIPLTDATVTITGTRWPLDHTSLQRGTTRGVSNEAVSTTVTVMAHSGVVMAITTRGDIA